MRDVARSAPQGAHFDADVINMLTYLVIKNRTMCNVAKYKVYTNFKVYTILTCKILLHFISSCSASYKTISDRIVQLSNASMAYKLVLQLLK